MALSRSTIGSGVFDYAVTKETAAIITPVENVRKGACALHSIVIGSGAAEVSYVKIYDSDGSDLVGGTTKPDLIIPIAIGSVNLTTVVVSIPGGLSLLKGLSYACSIEAGNTLTGSPTSGNVDVNFVTKDS